MGRERRSLYHDKIMKNLNEDGKSSLYATAKCRYSGVTALHACAINGYKELLVALLAVGCDVRHDLHATRRVPKGHRSTAPAHPAVAVFAVVVVHSQQVVRAVAVVALARRQARGRDARP